MRDPASLSLFVGWMATLAGILAGAVIGLGFHDEQWLGGYASFRRRLVRLGHISFFGLGFLNILFGLTARTFSLSGSWLPASSVLLTLGAISMPSVCFLSAWRKTFRHFFPLPVSAVFAGVGLLIWHLRP